MQLKYYTVDAFSTEPFKGNQAAVLPLEEKLDDKLMQNIASEFHISETAFVIPITDGAASEAWVNGSRFGLRWMTPSVEVNLCGHASLATAYVLFHKLGNKSKILTFETRSGDVLAKKNQDEIVLNLPQFESRSLTSMENEVCSPIVTKILGNLKIQEILMSEAAFKNLVIRLDDFYTREDLEAIVPFNLTHEIPPLEGIIVTLKGNLKCQSVNEGISEFHFISRYFTPWEPGYPEDPVTGSAHSSLGPFWADRLGLKEMYCRQCSPRGGNIKLSILPDNRMEIVGKAVAVMEGILSI